MDEVETDTAQRPERLLASLPAQESAERVAQGRLAFEAYRAAIYGAPHGGSASPDWFAPGALFVVSIGLLALAVAVFKQLEPQYAEIL